MQNKFEGVSDGELVSLARQGSELAFGELMARHSRGMQQIAISIMRDRHDAEDELQNAWWKAWQHLDSFEGESRFPTWVTRIVINQCLMRLRQVRRAQFLYLDAPVLDERVRFELREASDSPEEGHGRREIICLVDREIARLPPLLRRVLVLREMNQLAMHEVAGQLGISLVAAKSRLLRARHELRRRMEKHFGRMSSASLTG